MWLSDLPRMMIQCLLITIIVELIVAIIIGIRDKKDMINIILVNIVTNPLVTSMPVYFEIQYGINARGIVLVILEVLALFFEGIIYFRYFQYRKINGFLVSFILNIASFSAGELINHIFYSN